MPLRVIRGGYADPPRRYEPLPEQRKSRFSPTAAGTYLAPLISTRCYSRGKTEDAQAESKSSGETPVGLVPIKTEHSESSYRVRTSMRTDGRGELDALTTIARPSPHGSITQIGSIRVATAAGLVLAPGL